MCQRVTCSSCGKPTYAGCGRHVEAVLGDVSPEARCHCREDAKAAKKSSRPAESARSGGYLSALFRGVRRQP